MAEGNGVPRWVEVRFDVHEGRLDDYEARMRDLESWRGDIRVDIAKLVERRLFAGTILQAIISGAVTLIVALLAIR